MRTPVPVVQSGRGENMKEHAELIQGLSYEQKVKVWMLLTLLQNHEHVELNFTSTRLFLSLSS